ncbi:MAG: acyl-CoA dehydrogenase family protein [Anaerolineae bacterium]
MDFDLSREHQFLRKLVREFAGRSGETSGSASRSTSQPPTEVIKQAGEIGLFGVPFPREYGGMGAGETGYCILMEELGRVDTSFATHHWCAHRHRHDGDLSGRQQTHPRSTCPICAAAKRSARSH